MIVSPELSTEDLLKIANENHLGLLNLAPQDRDLLMALLKERGHQELEYGEEREYEKVRLVRRVTGAVSIFFEKDQPPTKTKKKTPD